MRIRQKKAFFDLIETVRSIEENPNDLESVRNLNLKILGLIQHSEKAIARHKKSRKELISHLKTGRADKKTSKGLRAKLKRVDSYIKAQRDQIYIWKCFGDAIAYIYLDTFSVKHAFFDTDRYDEKPASGVTIGKSGLKQEIGFFLSAISNGVPAILCDITNILRFGDVCLLGDSDPLCIEVKSNPKLNPRGKRQQAKLNILHNFMESDKADEFRGQPGSTIRYNIKKEPKYHLDALNDCISMAKNDGFAVTKPEIGITYITVIEIGHVESAFSSLDGATGELYFLNSYKNSHAWTPFSPFLLSIRDAEHVLDFIEGRINIVVAIEPQRVCDLMKEEGWEIRHRPEELYPIQFLHSETSAFSGISSQLIARCVFEFMSLATLADIGRPNLKDLLKLSSEASINPDKSAFYSRVIEFCGSDDIWTKRIIKANRFGNPDP